MIDMFRTNPAAKTRVQMFDNDPNCGQHSRPLRIKIPIRHQREHNLSRRAKRVNRAWYFDARAHVACICEKHGLGTLARPNTER